MNPIDNQDLELKHIANISGEKFFISTIKIEVRHSWLNQHNNVNIYETMIFEKKNNVVQYEHSVLNKRYTTYENAIEGHNHIVRHIEDIVKRTRGCNAKIV